MSTKPGKPKDYAAGSMLYGADARVAAWLVPRFALGVRLGLRTGTSASAPDGEVQPSALVAGLAAAFTLTRPDAAIGLDALARFDAERVTFVPTPAPRASGAALSDYALVASLGPGVWIAPAPPLRVGVEALLAAPLRAVRPADAHVDVAGVGGVGVAAQLGVSTAF